MNEQTWYEALIEWMFSGAWTVDIFAGGVLLTAFLSICWICLFIADCVQAFVDEEGLKWTPGDLEHFISFNMVSVAGSGCLAVFIYLAVNLFNFLFGFVLTNWFECVIVVGGISVLFMARTVRRLVKKINRHVANTEAHSKEVVKEEKKAQECGKPSDISLTSYDRAYYEAQVRKARQEAYRAGIWN